MSGMFWNIKERPGWSEGTMAGDGIGSQRAFGATIRSLAFILQELSGSEQKSDML